MEVHPDAIKITCKPVSMKPKKWIDSILLEKVKNQTILLHLL
jgi:hypothetical protein